MKQTLVLVHGWGYSARMWEGVRAALPGFTVFAPSLPPDVVKLEAWADRLAETIPEGAILAGWSLGAMLALMLAARHPQRVRGLYLLGASPRFANADDWPHGLHTDTLDDFHAAFLQSPKKVQRRFLALQTLGEASRALPAHLEQALMDPLVAHTTLLNGLSMLASTDLRQQAWDKQMPVHLVHGRHDALMPIAAAQWLLDRLPGATLHICEQAGHVGLLAHPEQLAADIRKFSHAV